jgi:hypothetical protein
MVNRFGLGRLANFLEVIGSYWVGILFLMFLSFLAAEIVTCFGFLMPRFAPSVRDWSLGLALVLCAIAIIQAHRAPVVTSYDVPVHNLPVERNGIVVVLLSDTHLGTMFDERWAAARIAQVKALHPDLIVLAGDIVEDHGAAKRKWGPVLGQLSAPLGVWAVDGNHEAFGAAGEHDSVLQDVGIHPPRPVGASRAWASHCRRRRSHGETAPRRRSQALTGPRALGTSFGARHHIHLTHAVAARPGCLPGHRSDAGSRPSTATSAKSLYTTAIW